MRITEVYFANASVHCSMLINHFRGLVTTVAPVSVKFNEILLFMRKLSSKTVDNSINSFDHIFFSTF